MINNLKNLIFDNRCLICRQKNLSESVNSICSDCLKAFVRQDDENLCNKCGHPLNDSNNCISCINLGEIYFDSYKFIQFYNEFFKNLINMLKKDQNFMVLKLFYQLLINKQLLDKSIPITVVPDSILKRFRKGRSGLNHILTLLERKGYRVIRNIYKRKIFSGGSQKLKLMGERLTHIREIYYLPVTHYKKYTGGVILIDDIYTTGATLSYGAKLLKMAGFSEVHAISFFRGVLENK